MKNPKEDNFTMKLILNQDSVLGDPWVPVYETKAEFSKSNFESALYNTIKQPNINSTVIMRADILIENVFNPDKGNTKFVSKHIGTLPKFPGEIDDVVLHRYYDDVELRQIPLENTQIMFKSKCEIVRRIIPRDPFKDYIINQTSVILANETDDSSLVVYIAHIQNEDETPFYLPLVLGIALLYHQGKLSIHYLPFNYHDPQQMLHLRRLDPNDRSIRIAQRLIETSWKHSQGNKDGYAKRVHHDLVVPKEVFQNRYISLKKKYSSQLVKEWVENTDPKKHVFEDLAIAAFLIEFWNLRYTEPFEFLDLGCGNGLLVYLLHMEGYNGRGVDARRRKSWNTYPEKTQACLLEKIIVPSVLLSSNSEEYFQIPGINDPTSMTYQSSLNLLKSDFLFVTDQPANTFIIGNHSDELTCWIPLLGYPFMVIPCCSHALSGAKHRFFNQRQNSTYGALVDHVEDLSKTMGWIVEKESLRIPSTRNVAIIGFDKHSQYKSDTKEAFDLRVKEVLVKEGGGDAWIENSINLMKKPPRNH